MRKRYVTYVWWLKAWRETNGDLWVWLQKRWRRIRLARGELKLVD